MSSWDHEFMNDLERDELAFRLAQQADGKALKEKMEADLNVQLMRELIKRSGETQKKPPSEH